MTSASPHSLVPLGEILAKSEDWIDILPDQRYRQVTIKMWGQGVVQRNEVAGGEIAASRRLRVHAGQFILSRIDARNGAIGIVPPELDGAVVSNDFPAFEVATDHVLPEFLGWMARTHDFVELCKAASEGTTNRVRLQEDRFLALTIPLPPLAEQRRVVARVEEIVAKVADARRLRAEAVGEVEALWTSTLETVFRAQTPPDSIETAEDLLDKQAKAYQEMRRTNVNNAHPWKPNIFPQGLYSIPKNWVWTDLGSVLTHLVDCINDTPNFSDYNTGFIGLKSTNIKPYLLDLSQKWFVTQEDFDHWNKRERPQAGDIILTREAPVGHACIFPENFVACLTQRLMLLRTDNQFISTRYVLHFLNSPHFKNQVLEHCRGLTTPHLRVGDAPKLLLPLPPLPEQRRIVTELDVLQAKMGTLRKLQAESAAELDALLPAVLDRAFRGEL